MKKSERENLRHNDLVDFLMEWGEKIKPHSTKILGAVILILVGYIAWTWTAEMSKAERELAWIELQNAVSQAGANPVELENVGAKYAGTEIGDRALVLAGNYRLMQATQEVFENKENAALELEKAFDIYQSVLERATDPAVRQQALFGLARAHETQAVIRETETSLTDAREQYRKLVDTYPDGFYQTVAEQRLQDLARPSTEKFFEDFAAWTPGEAPAGGSLMAPPAGTAPGGGLEYTLPDGDDRSTDDLLDSAGMGLGGPISGGLGGSDSLMPPPGGTGDFVAPGDGDGATPAVEPPIDMAAPADTPPESGTDAGASGEAAPDTAGAPAAPSDDS